MKKYKTFEEFWAEYGTRSLRARERYFRSIPKDARQLLVTDFFSNGWHELFVRNIINQRLDFIKHTYDIDVIDLRIKALKLGKVFLIENSVWTIIEHLLCEFDSYYDIDLLFGGLIVTGWGKKNQFCKIRGVKSKERR